MTSSTTHIPTGTVRHRFDDQADGDFTETLVALTEVADRERFDPSLVWTARRLVDNAPRLQGADRRCVILATLALLVAVDEGSTQLPLDSREYLDEMFGRWIESLTHLAEQRPDHRTEAIERLDRAANTLSTLRKQRDFVDTLTADEAGDIVGRVDDELPYRPLLLSGNSTFLTSERLLRKERELAERFAEQANCDIERFDSTEVRDAVDDLVERPTRYRADGRWHDQNLNWEQAHGALLPVFEPLTLLTGGPGTGKTTIVVSILRLLTRLGIEPDDIALAAPTGKAAQRLTESIDDQLQSLDVDGDDIPETDAGLRTRLQDARTLHRLLDYSPKYDRFFRNAETPLDARIVVCDEASMIDIEMMHALVRALPDRSRLVLVGDADQLPAVSGGAVFRDLVAESGPTEPDWTKRIEELTDTDPEQKLNEPADDPLAPNTSRLRKSYRMADDEAGGAEILRFARAIRDCDDVDDSELLNIAGTRTPLSELDDFEGVTRLHAETELDDFVEMWFQRHVDARKHIDALPDGESGDDGVKAFRTVDGQFDERSRQVLSELFDHYGRARILGVTRVFGTGAGAVNDTMHELHYESSGYEQKDRLMHLEPVMVQQNNYDLGIFNGDQGLVVYVSEQGEAGTTKEVVFPDSEHDFKTININQIRDQIELSYATTIHKAQGSEFDHVAVVLPEKDLPLSTRQLLYTGVTRASESVTIHDARGRLAEIAARPELRFSGLERALAQKLSK